MRFFGQASVEAIAIMGASLLILLVFFVLAAELLADLNVKQNFDDARRSVDSLAQAADSVYSQGEGASQTVQFTFPTNTVFGPSSTYIGSPANAKNTNPSTINVNVDGTDVYAITRAPLSGSFPSSHGTYALSVVSHGDYIRISQHIFESDRNSLYVRLAKNESRSEEIWLRMASNEEVAVNATLDWGNSPYVDASLSPESALVEFDGSGLLLHFTAGNAASGAYSASLALDGFGVQSGATEKITIPITVFVS